VGTVTLIDGQQVDSASEPWRAECEARAVLAMPGIAARRGYLADVSKRRGEVAGQALADLVRAVWSKSRENPN
jgi:hypothetical protein